jgi:hypothetical protein
VNRFPTFRGMLLGAAAALLIVGTAAVCYPEDTVDQVRIAALERLNSKVEDHETRLTHLEDAVMDIRESQEEAKWWYRGIGGALILAVLERILRTAGVIRKTDGLGPVG